MQNCKKNYDLQIPIADDSLPLTGKNTYQAKTQTIPVPLGKPATNKLFRIYLIFPFNTQPKKIGVDLRFRSQSLPGSFNNLGSHSRPVFIQKPEDRFLVPA